MNALKAAETNWINTSNLTGDAKWTIVEQNAVNGKRENLLVATQARACRSIATSPITGQPYYNLTGDDALRYNYADGTLVDGLLDKVDELVPREADYTDVLDIIKRRLERTDAAEGGLYHNTTYMPTNPANESDSAARQSIALLWKNQGYMTSTSFANNTTDKVPYNVWWFSRYYTPDSVEALRTVINGISWNYTAIDQNLINGKTENEYNTNTICYRLNDAITKLVAKEFRVTIDHNHNEGSTAVVSLVSGTPAFRFGDTLSGTTGVSWGGRTLEKLTYDAAGTEESGYMTTISGGTQTFSMELTEEEAPLSRFVRLQENGQNTNVYMLTLYAQWSMNVSKVMIDPDGGTVTLRQASASQNESISTSTRYTGDAGSKLQIISVQKTGYTFVQWHHTVGENAQHVANVNSSFANNVYTFGETKDAEDTLRAEWKIDSFTITFEPGDGSFAAGDTFTAQSNTKQVTYNQASYDLADTSGKTWPQDPVLTEEIAGQTVQAQFIGWQLNGVNFDETAKVTITGSITLTAAYVSTDTFKTQVAAAQNINANLYTTESLQALDNAMKSALKKDAQQNNAVITADSAAAIESAIAGLVEQDTDHGAPQMDVYETSQSVGTALSSFSATEQAQINAARANKGDITTVMPGSLWYTYFCYTNSETPFILVDANDVEYAGRTSYPTTVEMASGNVTFGDAKRQQQPLNSTGKVIYNNRLNSYWWQGTPWYTVDEAGAATTRNAGYTVMTKHVDNPFGSLNLEFAGSTYHGDDYSYYETAQYIVLTPTFVKADGRQYALYTFTVKDGTKNGEAAASATLNGEKDAVNAAATNANLASSGNTNITPNNTISIFVEYCNTMPAEEVGQASGGSAGEFLNVYTDFNENETTWKHNDWLNRTAGGEVMPREYAGYQTQLKDGEKYGSYVPRSPVYGANSVGSFYKALDPTNADDLAVINAYWNKYDSAEGTAQQKRLAASQQARDVMYSKVSKNMDAVRSALSETSQAVGAGNIGEGKKGCLGQYVAWPTTGATMWQTQFYAPARTRQESLVYVHLYDYFGNAYTAVLQRNYQEHDAPTAEADAVGHVTVTESGGSGIKQMKVTQYSYSGSGATLTALGNAENMEFNSSTNTFRITNLGAGHGTTHVFSLYIQDNAGHADTIDFCASTDDNGSVEITVVDTANMTNVNTLRTGDNAAAAPMTLVQAEETDGAVITQNTLTDVAAEAPEAKANEMYTFILNDVYTVNLFAVVDCDITLETNEGGMIKAYLDGEYAPVKAGKISAKSGQKVQIRAAAKAGYELTALVVTYEDGTTVDLLGDYASELTGNVTIRATFEKSDAKVTVTVENGAVNGQSEWTFSPYSRVTVTAAAAPEGKQFAYWAQGGADGTPVSYDEVYTFTVTGDTALTAVYSDTAVEKTAAVAMDPASENHITQVNGAYTLSYSGKIMLPEGATIEEFGMVLTNKTAEECTDETLVIGGERTAKLTATQMTQDGQYKMTVNNVKAGATRTGRLYATITLADGTTTTVYSDTWTELTTPNS